MWTQYVLFTQWAKLKAYANSKDVEIMGVVIVCSGDSSLNTAYLGTL